MNSTSAKEAARKLRAALDLHGAGVSLMRARLRRLYPNADESTIELHLKDWLLSDHGSGDSSTRTRARS